MRTALMVSLVVVASLLVFVILSQARSAGLTDTFGGGTTFTHTKRGPEKVLFIATIALAVLFFALALALPFVS